MKLPRILLAAGASGSGKTLITCGLLQALQNRGLSVASFKCGPDYIDPMFHTRVIGTKSRNLDTFFTGREVTRGLLAKNGAGCDIAVMEGVMGYYDGAGGITTLASAYDLADATDTPAVLIVNSKGMSVSLAALIKGFLEYRENSHIRGVIFNRMSPMLYPRMKKLVEEELGVRVLGYVPETEECVIESRHLGLVMPREIPQLQRRMQNLAEILEKSLDIDAILKLAQEAPEVTDDKEGFSVPEISLTKEKNAAWEAFIADAKSGSLKEPLRIGLSHDEAFCFFYEDNLALLKEMGAQIVTFSPLHDHRLPEKLDGLILCGGYPELNGQALEDNVSMRAEIARAIDGGLPCIAECGGFMYLHQVMEGMDGKFYRMAGVIPGEVFRTQKLTRFGYVTLTQNEPVFGRSDLGPIPAHEFHYFDSDTCGAAFTAAKPTGSRTWPCIHATETLLAGFPHFYYYANPALPAAFLQKCLQRRQMMEKQGENK